MKVFACKRAGCHAGGIILVAAGSIEQAFEVASGTESIQWAFDFLDEEGEIVEAYDPNVVNVVSSYYPIEDWFEFENMEFDCADPQVILEESYGE